MWAVASLIELPKGSKGQHHHSSKHDHSDDKQSHTAVVVAPSFPTIPERCSCGGESSSIGSRSDSSSKQHDNADKAGSATGSSSGSTSKQRQGAQEQQHQQQLCPLAACSPELHQPVYCGGMHQPISRIASWISTLPDVSSDQVSEGPDKECPSIASTHSSSLGKHEYEEAACDPELARGMEWASSKDSDMGEVCCCYRLSFLFGA